MKTKITIMFFATSMLLLGSIANISAQNWLTAGNGLTGGTSSTPNEWMGSNNLYDLILKTNNTQRMRVISGGHVLIGSGTAATYPLTLNDYTNAGTLNTGGNFAVSFHSIVGGAAIGSQDINNHAVFGVTGSTSDMLFATYNGSSFDERVRIMNGGNVGFGTPAPDIFGSGSAFRTLSVLGPNTSANSCGILELASKSTDADANIAGVLNFIASSNASTKQSIAQVVAFTQGTTATNRGGFLIFNTKPDGASATIERMRIDNTGNVGIGATDPVVKLKVAGDIEANNMIRATNWMAGTGSGIGAEMGVYGGTTSYFMGFNRSTSVWVPTVVVGSTVQLRCDGTIRLTVANAGNVGIGTTSPTALLHVNGSLYVNGTATQLTGTWGSDQMFKTDIDSINNALAIIKQLKPKAYYFDTTNVWGLNFPSKRQYGFVAQELEQVLPDLVTSKTQNEDVDSSGNVIHPAVTYKTVYYLELIAFLTKGMQEQSAQIESLTSKNNQQDSINTALKSELNQLVAKTNNQDEINNLLQSQLSQLLTTINSCCSTTRSMQIPAATEEQSQTVNQTNIELSSKNIVLLSQNSPNPFREQTTINYYLPDDVKYAQIIFMEQSGKIIKTVDLKDKGNGTLNVFAYDLSNGVYTYSLFIDGKVIETKKMVKQ